MGENILQTWMRKKIRLLIEFNMIEIVNTWISLTIKEFAIGFFQFLVIKALDLELDPDPHWDLDPQLNKMLDQDPYPDPH